MDEQLELTITEPLLLDEPEPPKPKKEKKPRKPMTPEHKEKLMKSLAKAREKSALNRGLKSKAKKILKAKDEAETMDIIRKSQLSIPDSRDDRIKELQNRLDGLTLQDVVVKPKRKPKPKPKPIPEEEEEEEEDADYTSTPQVEPNYVSKPAPQTQTQTPQTQTPVAVLEPKLNFKSVRGAKMKRRR